MLKKVIGIGLALCLSSSIACAENPQFQEYRNILNSGTYYLEYELDDVIKTLAVKDHRRMDYTTIKLKLSGLSVLNPLSVLKVVSNKDVRDPSSFYEYGKFYQFYAKRRARMAIWNQLNDENIDPDEGWNTVKQRLALPEELAIIGDKDEYNENIYINGTTAPVYEESGVSVINGKEHEYDKYVSTIKSATGAVLMEKSYFFYYQNGQMKNIKTFIKPYNGHEVILRTLVLKKLTQEIPGTALVIPEGTKVYAAGIGDMDDLLNSPPLVEDYTKKEEGGTTNATEED